MRIITGKAKGMKLTAPKGWDTRPTLDRVKEALFGSIQFDIEGARVLDLFAGSGGNGLEAKSRGADRVVLNDSSPDAVSCIRANITSTGLSDGVEVMQKDYRDALRTLADRGETFDFVLIDAPFRTAAAQDAVRLVFSEGILRPEGIVFLEHASDDVPGGVPGLYEVRRTKRYGSCCFSVLTRSES